jgi:hypothetical protein
MMKDKNKRDIALQTPDKGKKSKEKTPKSKKESEKENGKQSVHLPEDEDEQKDLHKGYGIGNFEKGSEGPQGYKKKK